MPSTDPSAEDGSVDRRRSGSDASTAFPREARLLNGRAYDAVFGDNRRLADRYWTVLAHRSTPSVPARLGLAVAKKRAKRAIDRNRIKRVARESFRHSRTRLDGFDVVVMNRDAAKTASTAELRTALDALWRRLPPRASGAGDERGR